MNREQAHRVHQAFVHTDNAINTLRQEFRGLQNEFKAMQKVLDKAYVQSLTHVMMWDCLMTLLENKGVVTKIQFDEALKELSEKTCAAMEADQKKAAEEADLAKGKVTVLSDQPAIPVVK